MGMKLGSSRRRDTGFQWLIIGIVLGMGCTFSFMLTLYVFEIIDVNLDQEATAPTTQVVVVTAEPQASVTSENNDMQSDGTNNTDSGPDENNNPATDASLPTPTATSADPTPLPGSETGSTTGVGTSDTNVTDSTASTPLPSSGGNPTPTIGFSISGGDTGNTGATTGDGAEIVLSPESPGLNPPPDNTSGQTTSSNLLVIASPVRAVTGGIFRMGTTEDEALQAVAECQQRDAGTCTNDFVTDSIPAHEVFVDSFQIEQFEVSVQQYVVFLNDLLAQNPNLTAPPPFNYV